jgi:hypothetical protein
VVSHPGQKVSGCRADAGCGSRDDVGAVHSARNVTPGEGFGLSGMS